MQNADQWVAGWPWTGVPHSVDPITAAEAVPGRPRTLRRASPRASALTHRPLLECVSTTRRGGPVAYFNTVWTRVSKVSSSPRSKLTPGPPRAVGGYGWRPRRPDIRQRVRPCRPSRALHIHTVWPSISGEDLGATLTPRRVDEATPPIVLHTLRRRWREFDTLRIEPTGASTVPDWFGRRLTIISPRARCWVGRS